MDLDTLYPCLDDIKRAAKRRLPHFVWEYVDSATGKEDQKNRNRGALDQILFETKVLQGPPNPNLKTTFLGREYALPFGIAPVGMSGMIWPGAETMLAKGAVDHSIPYCMSTVATVLPETVAPHLGDMGWFQLYPPSDPEIRRDILKRAKAAGFHTLVLTLDVPVASRRERQRRAQLTMPPKITPRMIWDSVTHPTWGLGTLKHGIPRLRLAEEYLKLSGTVGSTAHAGYVIRGTPDLDYFRTLRAEWKGPLVVKGIMTPSDATLLSNEGADAIWVSNHSGRQFDGGPASIDVLAPIRAAVGPDVPLIFDSGVAGGLDVLRALALGADFVMLGRAFHYALAAFGARGIDHLIHILRDDMFANMGQMGINNPRDARHRLHY